MSEPHPIKDVLTFFDGEYTRHVGTRYPINRGKDSKLVKDLLAIYDEPQLRSFITAFFEVEDDFIQQSGYSLGVFRGCLPKVIAFVNKVSKRTKTDTLINQNAEVMADLMGRSPLRRVK